MRIEKQVIQSGIKPKPICDSFPHVFLHFASVICIDFEFSVGSLDLYSVIGVGNYFGFGLTLKSQLKTATTLPLNISFLGKF